jgi:hypothetical protein
MSLTDAPDTAGQGDALHLFVDEAGDPTVFHPRSGNVIVDTPGCSRFFILGKLEVEDPERLAGQITSLRQELLADPYFTGIESFRRERKKTAILFHAKDDLPEVRYRVFNLLRAAGETLRFHAVIRDKVALAKREAEKRTRDRSYRYDPNTLYDGLVRSLFSKFHRLADHYYLAVAKRGQKDRNAALTAALEHAEKDFEQKFGFRRGGKSTITVRNPVTTVCLQAVDYFLWALQRFYEVRHHPQTGEPLAREDRFLNMLWPQIAEIHDLDFGRSAGTYFNPQRLLTLEDRFQLLPKKKKP